ncbi:EmrB/QacA subfamily drug resistance transporter [Actinoalloteichus hoggarensis]|uniref:Antiseptic resistance protein n=1 Tax=Actinoalloteichus hoggarensis TaxID=1470176 RepID=A0A221W7C7_9PSEU|nr:MFS transporter [Actinoalloteichus hoggarensis]ASO21654.1 Antiseptic resistance protein [Actinoalloteichus hoggarensis]MBB5922247.1 EmrB/QacA subfamily drug resistance transporter [Actinoalloteichus hoggarensis]
MNSRPPQQHAVPTGPTAVVADVRRRRTILIAVSVALMAVISSVTGLNVAQPDLAVDFGAPQGTVLWIINVYILTLAALLLPLGAVGDRWGRRPVLLAGLAVFGVANVVAGLAPSAALMIAARVLSGVGAAMIMPVTLAVITSTFPEKERGRAIGVWTGVAGGGGLLGMFLSAVLVDVVHWRFLFVLPVALVLVAAGMVLRSVPDSREAARGSFDTVGSLAAALAVVGLIYALHEGPEKGWSAPDTVVSLLVGVLGAAGFVVWELRHRAPLLDVRLFRERGLATGSVALLAVFGVQAGVSIVLYPFFQTVFGWSGLLSTVALLPMAGLMMVSSGLAPRMAERVGARATMTTGVLLAGVGLALLATLVSVDGGYPAVLPGMIAMGVGMGLSMPPATEAITSALPRDRQGVASALNDVTREFGTALGVALLGALLSAAYRTAVTPRLDGVPRRPRGPGPRGHRQRPRCRGRCGHGRSDVDPCGARILRRRLADRHVGGRRRAGGAPRPSPRPQARERDTRRRACHRRCRSRDLMTPRHPSGLVTRVAVRSRPPSSNPTAGARRPSPRPRLSCCRPPSRHARQPRPPTRPGDAVLGFGPGPLPPR